MTGTAVYGTVRTVVWEDGGGDPASYPINSVIQTQNLRVAPPDAPYSFTGLKE